eukprot:3836846-Ditylum_brightwellii.AAC.1
MVVAYENYLTGNMLDSTDDNVNHVPGQLNVPTIINLLGQNSFVSDEPWQTLLSHPNSSLTHDLKSCWTRLQSEYQQAVQQSEEDANKIITNNIHLAGADENECPPLSITRAITVELEEG